MIVCIAEKPSVAREIAQVLGATVKRDGFIEGNGYQVTWTFGHLCTLKEPHDYFASWRQWSLFSIPMIPSRFGIKLIEEDSYKKQFSVIKELMLKAEYVVNCGDAGQEGELIQRWVMQMTGLKCPVYRLWISSLTEQSIREGFEHIKDQADYNKLYEAGLSRAICDWLLGMNLTRLYTLKYGQNRQVLSIGRVQTPTLALIVKRQDEIDHFKPEPYWELKTVYRDVTFSAVKGKFKTVEDGEKILERIRGTEFEVTDISVKKGKEYAPKLFDLTSLQVECNKKYAFAADYTLKIIQSLYERKLTTYPRVDTTYLSDDMYPKVPEILKGLSSYAELTAPVLGKKIAKNKRVFDNSKVTDHHAIIPTGVNASGLAPDELKVYDLITRHFIAVFYPDCEISTTTVMGEAAQVQFKTTGKQILKPGWRVVFAGDSSSREDTDEDREKESKEGRELPSFVKGETGPHEPVLKEIWTTPPKPYTEATLLRAMETAGKMTENEEMRDALKENGIGRPSTRAAIIETLYKRNYIRKERKNLFPTRTGRDLIYIIKEELLKSVELTGIWERRLRMIERGEYQTAVFLEEMKTLLRGIVSNVINDRSSDQVTIEEKQPEKKKERKTAKKPSKKTAAGKKEVSLICPKCGKGTVLRGKTAFGCSEFRSGCDFRLNYTDYPGELTDAELSEILKGMRGSSKESE